MEKVEENKKEILDIKSLDSGLEILVQLAEKGEIDPWDVDIIEVTDKYLKALNKSPRENLLNAGRAIFYASVLLRLKSDILLNLSNETLLASQQTENYFPEDEMLFSEEEFHLDISKLESFLTRSPLAKLQRKRKISLGDLIFALQQAEEEEERRALRAKLRTERAFTIVAPETPDDIFEIAQEEDIDEVVEKIEAIIEEHLTDEKPITLSFLSQVMNNTSKPFLGLLFLAHMQKIVLSQTDFYGEVYIYKSGTIIEDPKTLENPVAETNNKPIKKEKKKGLVDKLREKIKRVRKKDPALKPEIAISDTSQSIEITAETTIEIKNSEEVITNGNNSGQSDGN
jgi:segregation and condensation protein A